MNDLLSKALLSGLGLASLTRDSIQKSVEDLVNRSKLSEEEGRKVVKDLQRRSVQARKSLEKEVDSTVHKLFEHVNLPAIINDRVKGAKPAKRAARKSPRRVGEQGRQSLNGRA